MPGVQSKFTFWSSFVGFFPTICQSTLNKMYSMLHNIPVFGKRDREKKDRKDEKQEPEKRRMSTFSFIYCILIIMTNNSKKTTTNQVAKQQKPFNSFQACELINSCSLNRVVDIFLHCLTADCEDFQFKDIKRFLSKGTSGSKRRAKPLQIEQMGDWPLSLCMALILTP